MGVVLDTVGKLIASYLQKEVPGYEPFTPSDPEHLRGVIQPGDVLLVEGNSRISGIIKYLTQSTWSHGALYVGQIDGAIEPDGEPHVLIEANIGAGDPTKIICSALIAQAFDAVRYPILPKITQAGSRRARREILHIRDSSLYMPRDFDISPYFEVVKPTIVHGFDYTSLHWADKQKPLQEVAGELGVFPDEIWSPALAPEEADETTPVAVTEVTSVAVAATMVERINITEHFLAVEY